MGAANGTAIAVRTAGALVPLEEARRLLAEAKSVDVVKDLRDRAEAIRCYARQAGLGLESMNDAAEIKLRAERRMGELLAETELHNGDPRLHDATRLSDLGVEKTQSYRCQRMAALPESAFEEHIAAVREAKEELTTAGVLALAPGNGVVRAQANSGNNEWYTPPLHVEAVRSVLGTIDLDPASCELAQQTVKATTYYTLEDDGLAHPWAGRVFLNPPYKVGLVDQFVGKLCDHVESVDVSAAVLLTNNGTETAWFQRAFRLATAVCFPEGRVKFLDCTGTNPGSPLQGQAILYFGPDEARFKDVFSGFGAVR